MTTKQYKGSSRYYNMYNELSVHAARMAMLASYERKQQQTQDHYSSDTMSVVASASALRSYSSAVTLNSNYNYGIRYERPVRSVNPLQSQRSMAMMTGTLRGGMSPVVNNSTNSAGGISSALLALYAKFKKGLSIVNKDDEVPVPPAHRYFVREDYDYDEGDDATVIVMDDDDGDDNQADVDFASCASTLRIVSDLSSSKQTQKSEPTALIDVDLHTMRQNKGTLLHTAATTETLSALVAKMVPDSMTALSPSPASRTLSIHCDNNTVKPVLPPDVPRYYKSGRENDSGMLGIPVPPPSPPPLPPPPPPSLHVRPLKVRTHHYRQSQKPPMKATVNAGTKDGNTRSALEAMFNLNESAFL